MRRQQLQTLIEAKGLSLDEVASMSSRTRVAIGLPSVIPQTDYNGFQRFMDSVVPFSGLRRMFGLDQDLVTDPIFNIADDNGKASQFYRNSLLFNNQRLPIYTMVEEMDTYDLANSILDLYAEEATQADPETHRVVWVECDDASLRSDLMDLMNRLGMDDRAFGIIRTMCKFGDDFEQIVTASGAGVTRLNYVHPARLSRIEYQDGRLAGFAAGILSNDDCIFENVKDVGKVSYPWDFAHFRLQSNNRDSKHGDSILMGARRAYQQLKMIEDMLVLYRMSRGMDRDVYFVNTAGNTQTQAWRTIHEFRQEVRKKLAINTGVSMRQEYNMRTPDDDLFIPVAGKEDPTRVERQTGGAPQGTIDDVDHFRRKFLGAMRVPSAFVGFESDTPAKNTLASQDIRFARSIKRIQRAFKQGVRWICEVHLINKGQVTRDELGRMLAKFNVRMSPINQLEELAKVEIYKARMDLITEMMTLVGLQQQMDPTTQMVIPGTGVIKNIDGWVAWTLRKFMDLTDDEIELFLGDRNAGLTLSDFEIKKLNETLDKTKISNKLATAKEVVVAMREIANDDEAFVIDVRGDKAKPEFGSYNLLTEEMNLKERLGHTGDGPVMVCPKCKDSSAGLKRDMIEHRSYLLCKCGYIAYTEDGDIND